MKKIVALLLALTMLLSLTACGGSAAPGEEPSTEPSTEAPTDASEITEAPETEESTEAVAAPDPSAPVTELFYSSEVTGMEGQWTLAQVYANGEIYEAVENAANFAVTLELDPSELVDQAAYTHNKVYNLTGDLSFGIAAVNEILSADGLDGYRGATSWSDFPQGKVMAEGKAYQQPGPATMRFHDVDAYGLFLEQLADGAPADLDTTGRNFIIGMNNHGQLLLGTSDVHLERPSVEGDWTYCLIFNKAA